VLRYRYSSDDAELPHYSWQMPRNWFHLLVLSWQTRRHA